MTDATDTTAKSQEHPFLRFLALVLGGAAILFWLVVAHASVADALPLAKDVRLGLYTTLAFLLLAWPGLILAICNVAIRRALALTALAAAIDAAIYAAYLPPLTGPLQLQFAALIAVLLGTFWTFGRPGASDGPEFEQVKLRLAVLYGAGLGTALWLSSFAVAIEVWARGRGDGFELIPAFYGTIFWLAIVLPLMVIGLGGTERRSPTLVRFLLGLTLASSVLFGLPQLFG
jgi:hypothetical protein